MHSEIKLSEGVYVTDFRKGQQLQGLEKKKSEKTKDLGLLLDEIKALELKIQKLIESNEAMKEEEDWEKEEVYLQAISENYGIIVGFSEEMKQKIVDLFSMNYKPQNQKMEELLNGKRIEEREEKIRQEAVVFQKYLKKQEPVQQKNSSDDEGVYL